ncbi:MAG: Ig-like domain-containing protein [Candidatus Wallbacteria bacterium]|nr:Ig-like domain-containing protein [Candidatus Wallbacteria bacterium]
MRSICALLFVLLSIPVAAEDIEGPPVFSIYLCRVIVDGSPVSAGATLQVLDSNTGKTLTEYLIVVPGVAGFFSLSGIAEGTELQFYIDGRRLSVKEGAQVFRPDMNTHDLFLHAGIEDVTPPELISKGFVDDFTIELRFNETIGLSKLEKNLFVCDEPIEKISYTPMQNGIRIKFESLRSNFVYLELNGDITDLSGNEFVSGKMLIFK